MRLFMCTAAMVLAASGLRAESPRVVTDIAPVQLLVNEVMKGAGEADVLLPPGASPHGYAMRPSDARALSSADLVVWIGPVLSPWLADPVETLASGAVHLTLADTDGITLLPFRTGDMFDGHSHDHEGHGHEDHADDHKDHDGHGHEDHADDHKDHDGHGHEDHADDHKDHDGHDHAGGADPHIWLDPGNAKTILSAVAEALAEMDPEHADLYKANAQTARSGIDAASAQISDLLAPHGSEAFIVFHDAYYYFEAHFGLEARGAISLAHGEGASAGQLGRVRDTVAETGAHCILTEPLTQTGLIDAVTAGGEISVGVISPVDGVPGAVYASYPDFLADIGTGFASCLSHK